jgi:hypothetical protein
MFDQFIANSKKNHKIHLYKGMDPKVYLLLNRFLKPVVRLKNSIRLISKLNKGKRNYCIIILD